MQLKHAAICAALAAALVPVATTLSLSELTKLIVGLDKDLGRTGGFGIFSLNAGWRPSKIVQLTGGVDNLFNKLYSENLNKGGAAIPGFATPANVRLNEPGRNLWVKANIAFD